MESLRNRRGDICIIQAIIAIYVEVLIFLSISQIFVKPLLAKKFLAFIYIYIFKGMCFKKQLQPELVLFLTKLVSLLGGGFCLRFGEPEIQ